MRQVLILKKHTLVSIAMAWWKERVRGRRRIILAPGLVLMVRSGRGIYHSHPITTLFWNIFSICRRLPANTKTNIYSGGIMSRRLPPKVESSIYLHRKRSFISFASCADLSPIIEQSAVFSFFFHHWHICFQHDMFSSAFQWVKIVKFLPDRENEFHMFMEVKSWNTGF